MRAKSVCACLLFVATATAASARTTDYAPERCYGLVGLGEIAMSPGGDWAAFTVTTVVEDENRRHREVWLQPLELIRYPRSSHGLSRTGNRGCWWTA